MFGRKKEIEYLQSQINNLKKEINCLKGHHDWVAQRLYSHSDTHIGCSNCYKRKDDDQTIKP